MAAMDERHRSLESRRCKDRAEWLAGFGWINHKSLAGQVFFAIFPGLREFTLVRDDLVRVWAFEFQLFLANICLYSGSQNRGAWSRVFSVDCGIGSPLSIWPRLKGGPETCVA